MNEILRAIARATFLATAIPLFAATVAGGTWIIVALELPLWSWLVLVVTVASEIGGLALVVRSSRRVTTLISSALGVDPLERFISPGD